MQIVGSDIGTDASRTEVVPTRLYEFIEGNGKNAKINLIETHVKYIDAKYHFDQYRHPF